MHTRFNEKIIDAQTAQNSAGQVPYGNSGTYTEAAFYVAFNGTAAAGAVVIETAHDPNYAGTWANLATVTFAAASRVHHVAVTGVFRALRARISSAVTSGTVDVYAIVTG